MKKSAVLFLFINLIFLIACEGEISQKDKPKESTASTNPFPTDGSIPEDTIIRLNRTVCYGTCPAYLLTVKANGEVNFFGQDFVETKGQAKDEISKQKVKQLVEEFKKAKFFDLKDNYTSIECATDNPTVRTTLFINGKVKKIEHDTGCKAPKELTVLEDKIDEIVGTEKWIGKGEKSKSSEDKK